MSCEREMSGWSMEMNAPKDSDPPPPKKKKKKKFAGSIVWTSTKNE